MDGVVNSNRTDEMDALTSSDGRDERPPVGPVPASVVVTIVAMLGVLLVVGWFVRIEAGRGSPDDTVLGIPPPLTVSTPSGTPTSPEAAPTAPSTKGTTQRPGGTGAVTGVTQMRVAQSWVANVAGRTGIPSRALTAYADAQLSTDSVRPGCHLSWVMLAGIGKVESGHGSHGGAQLRPDGTTSIPILGPPLNGTHGNIALHATPEGIRLDGDSKWDHAIGPMQFLPSTWSHWGVSADGGTPDPSDIDDAALTAADYLCANGRDLSTVAGWRDALAAYNAPQAYAVLVTNVASGYARSSLG
jgi:membrane-bound lytic murein transglycosylase B